MNRQILIFIILIIPSGLLLSQSYTSIPDTCFEKELIAQGLDQGNIDGRVMTANINTIKNLYVISKNISDLSGIQDFTDLETLNCSYNKLITLNLGSNTKLKSFDCSFNQITGLNLSNNVELNSLQCSFNQLTVLNIAANTSLTVLNCSNNFLTNLDISKNTLLSQLTCSSNQLKVLDISYAQPLLLLNCSDNQIISLNTSLNTLLINLFCASNQIGVLDLSNNDSLLMIDCSSNQIKNLDVSENLMLKYLTCSSNQISIINLNLNDSLNFLDISNNQLSLIDISGNDSLFNLICSSNQIKSIDFTSNKDIERIDLSRNQIRDLDFSQNVALESIDCSENLLKSLNVNNLNNGKITSLIATGNPYLRCIKVDNSENANSNPAWKKDSIASYNTNCAAYTYIPDDKFEAELIKLGYDNGALDNYVLTSNIQNITFIDIDSLNITDLTGIEDFINLDSLDCSHNQLYNLDVSKLTKLQKLDCSSDSLVDLNLKNGSNPIFQHMNALGNSKLKCIQVDDVAEASTKPGWFKETTAFYNIACISDKTYIPDDNFEVALIELGLDKGSLDDYVVTDSIKTLSKLNISNRNIFDLTGIQGFIAMDTFDCSKNKISSLDISMNLNINNLNCSENFLTVLDVQKDTSLISLICGDNKLSSLDLSRNIKLQQLKCNGNFLKNIDLANDTNLLELNCNSNFISNLDVGSNLKLKKLYCANNKLPTIDLTNNDSLLELDCAGNLINILSLQTNQKLERLDCSQNFISSLDLSKDTLLVSLKCNSNDLSSLNFDKNPLLRTINCSSNKLTTISLAKSDSIRELNASNNKLSQIPIDRMHFLNILNLSNNQIAGFDFNNNDSLRILLCSTNLLKSINIDNCIFLETLKCDYNNLNSLDVSKNASLVEIDCSNNSIATLDLSKTLNLKELTVDYNKLTSLDIHANTSLTKVSCANNKLSDLDFSPLNKLASINCSSNFLTSLNGRNGSNGILETFYSFNNPNLHCIEIDNPSNIGVSWRKDASASYTINCHYFETYVPDNNFEASLSEIINEPINNNDNYFPTASIKAITTLDISNKNIIDLTGLQDFTELTSLNCSLNQIDSLNLTALVKLTNLNCANNQIDTLDLSKNTALTELNFSSNYINNIEIANLTTLTGFTANNNMLTSLDLRYNSNISNANLASNQLVSLKVNNGNNAVLTTFNANNNTGLFCIEVDDPILATSQSGSYAAWQVDAIVSYGDNCHYNQTFVPDDAFEELLIELGYDNTGLLDDYVPTAQIDKITYLNAANKGISDLTGVEDFNALVTLNCANNNLQSLYVNNNLNLVTLICSGNNLSGLNILSNILLKKLDITDNSVINLDLTGNIILERLFCSANLLKSLNILSNTNLLEVNCSSNQLLSVDANNGSNNVLLNFDLRNNPDLRCILVDDIAEAAGTYGWYKDQTASYKLECNDDDNDGVIDTEDNCPDTPFGDLVDVFGCSLFTLPSDNFTILTKSETCRDRNNGIVKINAIKIFNYTATLTGTLDTVVFKFTNDAEIRNLRADTYKLCITIDKEPDYSQCYQVFISQPEDLNVKSAIDQSGRQVTFKMEGGTIYKIDFNGTKFNTTDKEITLELENGINTVQIMADAICQGLYKEMFFVSEKSTVYPNPFNNYLYLYSGENTIGIVEVKIFSSSGMIVLDDRFQSVNGAIEIPTSKFKPGIYYLWMKTQSCELTIKIVKE